jgi:lysophospholipase L1-like esterase
VAAVPPPDPERARLAAIEAALVATGVPPAGHAENQDLRIDAWNQVLGQAAAARGVPVIDVAARMRSWPGGEFDPDRRAGGVGLTGRGARDVLGWLAPVLRTAPVPAPPGPPAGLEPDAPLPPAPAPAPRRVVAADRPVNVLVVGDSVAFNLGYGLLEVGRASGDLRAANAAQFGCPVARGGSYRFLRDVREFPARCDWAQLFPRFLAEQNPDLVVLASGIWEVVDRRFVGDDRWRHIGMPEVDRYLLREFLAAVDTLGSTGATVALVTYPRIEAGADRGFVGLPESDPARIERLNQLLAQVVALRPGVATLVDLRGWLAGQPGGESDPAARPDGVHFSDDYSVTVARWLAPVLGDLARRET